MMLTQSLIQTERTENFLFTKVNLIDWSKLSKKIAQLHLEKSYFEKVKLWPTLISKLPAPICYNLQECTLYSVHYYDSSTIGGYYSWILFSSDLYILATCQFLSSQVIYEMKLGVLKDILLYSSNKYPYTHNKKSVNIDTKSIQSSRVRFINLMEAITEHKFCSSRSCLIYYNQV